MLTGRAAGVDVWVRATVTVGATVPVSVDGVKGTEARGFRTATKAVEVSQAVGLTVGEAANPLLDVAAIGSAESGEARAS